MKRVSEVWCPHVRQVFSNGMEPESITAANAYNNQRDQDSDHCCIGSRCAMWETFWATEEKNKHENTGRCGLANGQWLEDDL